MVHHPHVQLQAQAEIDKVIGVERLPTIEDFDNLPYVQAIVKEVRSIYPKKRVILTCLRPTGTSHLFHLEYLTCPQLKRWYVEHYGTWL